MISTQQLVTVIIISALAVICRGTDIYCYHYSNLELSHVDGEIDCPIDTLRYFHTYHACCGYELLRHTSRDVVLHNDHGHAPNLPTNCYENPFAADYSNQDISSLGRDPNAKRRRRRQVDSDSTQINDSTTSSAESARVPIWPGLLSTRRRRQASQEPSTSSSSEYDGDDCQQNYDYYKIRAVHACCLDQPNYSQLHHHRQRVDPRFEGQLVQRGNGLSPLAQLNPAISGQYSPGIGTSCTDDRNAQGGTDCVKSWLCADPVWAETMQRTCCATCRRLGLSGAAGLAAAASARAAYIQPQPQPQQQPQLAYPYASYYAYYPYMSCRR